MTASLQTVIPEVCSCRKCIITNAAIEKWFEWWYVIIFASSDSALDLIYCLIFLYIYIYDWAKFSVPGSDLLNHTQKTGTDDPVYNWLGQRELVYFIQRTKEGAYDI